MTEHVLRGDGAIPSQDLLRTSFQVLAEALPDHLGVFSEWLDRGVEGLSLSREDCERNFVSFAKERSGESPDRLVGAFFVLEGLRRQLEFTPSSLVRLLSDNFWNEEELGKQDEKTIERIEELFSGKDTLDLLYKASRVYEGAIPNFVGCRSICDFRPIYDEKRQEILAGVLTATLQVSIRESAGERQIKDLNFQLDLADVEMMVEELDRIRKKALALKNLVQSGSSKDVSLLNPTKSFGKR
jgi:hypothetical protein